jgi:hypothetical protein
MMYSLIPHQPVLHIRKEVPSQLRQCADIIHIQFSKELLSSFILGVQLKSGPLTKLRIFHVRCYL